jgi:hypothetical protein
MSLEKEFIRNMLKLIFLLPLLICIDLNSSYAIDDISGFVIISVCQRKDIKYNINLNTVSYNILSIEF